MKNKLYISLFAVVVSSATVVTVIGTNTGRDGQGINPTVWGGTVATMNDQAPDWSKIVQGDKPGMLGASMNKPMYGANKSTYAPSELENTLRRRARALVELSHRISSEFDELANSFSFFRQNEPEMFERYFGSKETGVPAAVEAIQPLPEDEDNSDV